VKRSRGLVVAIDGPAGAGKTTVSKRLAERLGYTRVDTGALYRALALAAKERGVPWSEGEALGALARSIDLGFQGQRVTIDGRDREGEIRTPEISQGASIVSAHAPVRAALLELQRRLGSDGGVVLEGRDIGTVVFPDAEAKIFLTATDEERARRRAVEIGADAAEVLREMRERDARDSGRAVAPLKPAPDAVHVDTSGLGLDEVVDRLAEIVRKRLD
jgi:cytidylate kinase